MNRVHIAKFVDVGVEHDDLGLHALRDPGRVLPGHARPEHQHPGRGDAAHAAHQHPPTARLAFQQVRADLRSHAPGDLAHGREQGQAPVGQLHRLVGDRGDPRLAQRLGQLPAGRQVQVGEQHLVGPHAREFLGDRLLHLQDEVRLAPDLVRRAEHSCAGPLELGVPDRAAFPRSALDQHPMAAVGQRAHARGGDRDAVLVVLQLAGDAYVHGARPFPVAAPGPAEASMPPLSCPALVGLRSSLRDRAGHQGHRGRACGPASAYPAVRRAAARRAGASGGGAPAGSGLQRPARSRP